MTPEERLMSMISTAEPQLSPEDLADCLILAAVPDSSGRFINDDGYEPDYDYHRAAAEAFRRKAAIVAADYSVTIEGREINRGQMIDNLLKMAAVHDSKAQPRYMAAPDTRPSWRV